MYIKSKRKIKKLHQGGRKWKEKQDEKRTSYKDGNQPCQARLNFEPVKKQVMLKTHSPRINKRSDALNNLLISGFPNIPSRRSKNLHKIGAIEI
jgi:hypothetical protein